MLDALRGNQLLTLLAMFFFGWIICAIPWHLGVRNVKSHSLRFILLLPFAVGAMIAFAVGYNLYFFDCPWDC